MVQFEKYDRFCKISMSHFSSNLNLRIALEFFSVANFVLVSNITIQGTCSVLRISWHMFCPLHFMAHAPSFATRGTCFVLRTSWNMFCPSHFVAHVLSFAFHGTCSVLRTSWHMFCPSHFMAYILYFAAHDLYFAFCGICSVLAAHVLPFAPHGTCSVLRTSRHMLCTSHFVAHVLSAALIFFDKSNIFS
jgi:hypothetical protein